MSFKKCVAASSAVLSILVSGAECVPLKPEVRNLLGITSPEKDPQSFWFNKQLPADFFEKLKEHKNIQLYPPFSDRKRWQKAATSPLTKKVAKEIIRTADKKLSLPPVELTQEDFCRFIHDGNRSVFEKKYFSRRNALGEFALALCLTGDKEKYMKQIVTYTKAILQEDRWCIPAHCKWKDKELLPGYQCDLFASDTAAVMALIYNILGDELEAASPGIKKEIRQTTLKHTFENLLSPATSKLNYWYPEKMAWNWLSWISGNLVTTALVLAPTPELRAEYIQITLFPLSRFVTAFGKDGYSAEGPTYFYGSAGMLYNAVDHLDRCVPGTLDVFLADERFLNIITFLGRIKMGKNFATYSDASPKVRPSYPLTARIAGRLNSPEMAELLEGAVLRMNKSMGQGLIGNLYILFDIPEKLPAAAQSEPVSTLFHNRLAILRTSGFSASLKAGDNEEPHNHNDLGHFTVYDGDKPVIIDAGTGSYSRKNFGPLRYTLWFTRGSGHNAPVIDGVEQIYGKNSATLSELKQNGGFIECVSDLSRAYPEKAGVRAYTRLLRCSKNTVEVCDDLKTGRKDASIEISLLTQGKPVVENDRITIGKVVLVWQGLTLRSCELEAQKFSAWDEPVYRIVFQGKSGKYSMKFTR